MNKPGPFYTPKSIDSGRRSSLRWVEDSGDSAWFNGTSANSDFLSLSLSSKKIRIFFLVIIVGLLALLGKGFYLQIMRGNYYFSQAENNRTKTEYIPAHRGIIYDRGGKPLVQNVSGFSLIVTPSQLPQDSTQLQLELGQISQLAGISLEDISSALQKNKAYYYQPIVLKTGIAYDDAMAIKIASVNWQGVELDNDFWRNYLDSVNFSHIFGYVGKINADEYDANKDNYFLTDNIGKTGLEKSYESYLRGQYGKNEYEVDALGRIQKVISQTPSVSGDDLILSLDSDLQDYIYTDVSAKIHNSTGVVVIVSNPQTGEILAMVDYPSYDNNLFSKGISKDDYKKLMDDPLNPLFSRSYQGEYPSGSTVKIVESSGALQEGIITKNTTVLSTGGIHIQQWFFPDWKAGGHGVTNVIKAIAQSVNTFFYYIGGGYGNFKGLGPELLDKYFIMFGLGHKTGIDLPGERSGFVPTVDWKNKVVKQPWYIGDTYHLAIGQGDLLVTPLQVNLYTQIVANGGTIYKPHFLHQINFSDGKSQIIQPEVVGHVAVSPENLAIVRQGMRETIVSGSARSLATLPVEVAGKTGTAQWNTTKPNHAWFTAFAPYNNPNFCITVLVEQGGEGSSIAAPIAKDIVNYWFTRKE